MVNVRPPENVLPIDDGLTEMLAAPACNATVIMADATKVLRRFGFIDLIWLRLTPLSPPQFSKRILRVPELSTLNTGNSTLPIQPLHPERLPKVMEPRNGP